MNYRKLLVISLLMAAVGAPGFVQGMTGPELLEAGFLSEVAQNEPQLKLRINDLRKKFFAALEKRGFFRAGIEEVAKVYFKHRHMRLALKNRRDAGTLWWGNYQWKKWRLSAAYDKEVDRIETKIAKEKKKRKLPFSKKKKSKVKPKEVKKFFERFRLYERFAELIQAWKDKKDEKYKKLVAEMEKFIKKVEKKEKKLKKLPKKDVKIADGKIITDMEKLVSELRGIKVRRARAKKKKKGNVFSRWFSEEDKAKRIEKKIQRKRKEIKALKKKKKK